MKKILFRAMVIMFPAVSFAKAFLPLTPGEVVIEPFFGPYRDYQSWKTESKVGSFEMSWGQNLYILYSKGQGAAGSMTRTYKQPLDCSGFDKVIFGLRPHGGAEGTKYTMSVVTDAGVKESSTEAKKSLVFCELAVDISGAKEIKSITISYQSPTGERGRWDGQLTFIIMRNSKQFALFREFYDKQMAKIDFDRLLKSVDYTPKFDTYYNIVFRKGEFGEYRKFYTALPGAVLKSWGEGIKKLPKPETFIDVDFAELAFRRIYVQEKYKKYNIKWPGGYLYQQGNLAALAGALYKDKVLLRLAARYALTLAAMSSWNDRGVMDNLPGSWYMISFTSAAIAREMMLIMDLAGDMFTDDGRRYVIQALARKALADAQYSLWSRPLYKSNQFSIFSIARIVPLLLMEKESYNKFDQVQPYTDLVIADLNKSTDMLFAADGGFFDCSTGYLGCTIDNLTNCYEWYANARGKKLSEVVAANLLKSSAFATIISSTTNKQLITIGEAKTPYLLPAYSGFMALVAPGSQWQRIFEKTPPWLLKKMMPRTDYRSWIYMNALKKNKTKIEKVASFIDIPSCGLVSSLREGTKIVLMGCNYNNKRHGDVGDFVIEFAGQTFAMSTPYSWDKFGTCHWHNLLIPSRSHSLIKQYKGTECKAVPVASGDAVKFEAKIKLRRCWERKLFRKLTREISSPSATQITITDRYELGLDAEGVDFLWHTPLPTRIEGKTITITAPNGAKALITVPDGCEAKIEKFTRSKKIAVDLGLKANHEFSKIIIHCPKSSGELKVKVKLIEK